MANDIEFRSFVSKVYFTRSINANSPGFLERNLRHALDAHERELSREKKIGRADEPAVMSERRRTRSHAWDFPSEKITEELIQANKAKLRIKSIVLQDPTKVAPNAVSEKRPRQQEQSEWCQEPDQFKLPCQVVVTVNDARSQPRTIATAARQGEITKHGNSTLEITFTEPFIIRADELTVHTTSATGAGTWTKTFHKNYSLGFEIHCQDSDDTAEFLSQLEGRPISEYLAAPWEEGIVKSSWSGFPGLPQVEEPLPLHRLKGQVKLVMRYVAHVDTGWNKRESPLSTYNKVLRKTRNEARQLPTPSEDPERVGAKILVKYAYQQGFETKGMPVEHLRCIFCTNDPEHGTFERLHLHYLTRHDHFQYEVQITEGENGNDLRTIRITHDDDKHTSNEKEFEWEAPQRPFDISAHLEGISPWTVRNTKQMTSRGLGRPRKEQPLVLVRPKRRDAAPEDVEKMSPRTKKRHVVPRVPGIKFYRTKSKQSVQTGTELSDSEDDVDETWLLQRQQRHRAKLGASLVAQQFNELFNKYLDIEGQPQSDVLVRDAVVRFVREHARQLAQPGWNEEFDSKLKLFQSVNIVDQATVIYCQKKVSEAEDDLDGPTPLPDENDDQHAKVPPRRPATPNRRIRENLPSQVRGTVAVFDGSRDAEHQDVQTKSPISNGVIPESPTGTPSTKNRMRWTAGRMKSASVEPDKMDIDPRPLGHRTLICIRPAMDRKGEQSTGELPITEFIKDGHSQTPIDEIQPSDLDYKKFLRILDDDMIYIRAVDNIVCISNATRRPVVDRIDWREALRKVQAEGTGPIKFLLGPLDLIMNSQGDTPKKGKKKVEVAALKAKQPVPADATEKPCVCGEYVNSLRNTIGCGNPRCHRDFHMPCVQLQKRSMDWLCLDCSS